MNRYRKKPAVIDAFRIGIDYILDWFMNKVSTNEIIKAVKQLDKK